MSGVRVNLILFSETIRKEETKIPTGNTGERETAEAAENESESPAGELSLDYLNSCN